MHRLARALLIVGLASLSAGCAEGDGRSEAQGSAGLGVQEGHVAAGPDVNLFYRLVGTGSDTLVVVHGGPGFNMDYFFDDLQPLTDRLTLIFYDQRGTGQSSLVVDSAQLAASWFAEDLEAVRSHFGLGRLNILGHSWGAGVAALYAMRYPTNVSRLLIVGGIPLRGELLTEGFSQLQMSRDSSEIQEMEELYAARLTNPEDAEVCRAYYGLWFRPFFGVSGAADRSRGDFCSGSGESRRNKMQSVDRFTMASLGDWDWRDSLRDLDAPTLVIHGTSDPIPVAGAWEWVNTLPNARLLLLDDIGHFPYLEAPDQFFSAVREFAEGSWPVAAQSAANP